MKKETRAALALIVYGGLFYLSVMIYALFLDGSAEVEIARLTTAAVAFGVLVPLVSIAYGTMGAVIGRAGVLLCLGNAMLVTQLVACVYDLDELYGRGPVCAAVFFAVFFFTATVRVLSLCAMSFSQKNKRLY